MKRILVPMDFSEVGVNALKYALDAFPESQITVLNVKTSVADLDITREENMALSMEKKWEEQFTKVVFSSNGFSGKPDNVFVKAIYGPIVTTVSDYINNQKMDAVVMGTRDKYDVLDRLFGTVTLGVVKNAKIPVHIIPRFAKYEKYDKVVIGSDFHLRDKIFLQIIKSWNDKYNAFLKFVNVKSDPAKSFQKVETAIVDELFGKEAPAYGVEIATTEDDNVVNGLLGEAYNFGANLLIMIPDNQTFMQSLLFKSTSKDAIIKSKIPLLFIPYN